jgi:hypothetical protein
VFSIVALTPGEHKGLSIQIFQADVYRTGEQVALLIDRRVGLPVTVIVGSVIWLFVVQSENPNVRWQVFQTLQIGHALWPPFMFMWFYHAGRRQSKNFIENLIASVDEADSATTANE